MASMLRQRINSILQQLFPRTFIYVDKTDIKSCAYKNNTWHKVEYHTRPHNSFFGQETLLIPAEHTLFRVRAYPCSQISKTDLIEAIELDIESWSPWLNNTSYYCWPEQENKHWKVALWVWDKNITKELITAHELTPTHVMPSQAFSIAALKEPKLPCIYIANNELKNNTKYYTIIKHSGAPATLSIISNSNEAKRFWAQLTEEEQTYNIYSDEQNITPEWLPNITISTTIQSVPLALPTAKAHKYARQTGVKDWSDAFTWLKPMSQLLGVYILWLLGSTLILWQQSETINKQVTLAKSEAIEVVRQRENIERIHNKLIKLYKLRAEQSKFEQLLAVLSNKLPKNVWLDAIKYDAIDGGWADIEGKSPQSGGLAAVLEALPQIEHALFLNDIRMNAKTGLEPFKIRVKLTAKQQQINTNE